MNVCNVVQCVNLFSGVENLNIAIRVLVEHTLRPTLYIKTLAQLF